MSTKTKHAFLRGKPQAIPERDISLETCKRMHYWIGEVPEKLSEGHPCRGLEGQEVHIANFYNPDGTEIVGQKVRTNEKDFRTIGDVSKGLFGAKAAKSGKLLVVTEGEIDALSYVEARNGSWPAVSIPNGVSSARKALEANIEYLEGFDKVVLQFDNDKVGLQAVDKCKGVLSPGKLAIGSLPSTYKDYNEALKAGDVKAIMESVFQAKIVRPDGIVSIDDIIDRAKQEIEPGLPYFDERLSVLTYGRFWGEIITLGGGTGCGKTDWLTQQALYDINVLGHQIGMLFLEADPLETTRRLAGKVVQAPLHLPGREVAEEVKNAAYDALRGSVMFYDSFGQTEWERVRSVIRHMNKAEDIRIFYLDHLTALADTADEKGSLEQLMKEISGLAQELEIIIHCVSHLTTPEKGLPHEEGGRVMIRHFKGSRAIGFWSHQMFGIERDTQADNAEDRNTTFRILKCRQNGPANGKTIEYAYDEEKFLLVPVEAVGFEDRETVSEDF